MGGRVVVVGGDAAGMSAATTALRGDPGLEVVALERGSTTSYSACGIPYWIAGDLDRSGDGPGDARARLVARTPVEHRRRGVDVRLRTEVEGLDLAAGRVHVRDLDTGRASTEPYDQLVLATGAVPVRPDLPGADARGVLGVQTLDDGEAVIDALRTDPPPRTAVVVGGGYIGVEMAEALVRRGLAVTVVTRTPEPMATLDPDMGALVRRAMEGMGIDVRTGVDAEAVLTDRAGRVRAVRVAGEELACDLVVLGLGVRPASELAREAGLVLGDSGGVRTDLRMRACGREEVWAGGDCVEVLDLVTGRHVHVPLGTHANKHGRVIGTNLGGGYATFPGVVRTAVSKVCALEIGRTGLLEDEAAQAGFAFVTATVETTTRAGYLPDAQPLTVKLLAERRTGRLLGAQVVGRQGSAKRLDAAAVALWNRMTVEEMTALDLGYAPPFSSVWDPVLVAARQASDRVIGVTG